MMGHSAVEKKTYMKLICVFVFAYIKSRFSHDEAHIIIIKITNVLDTILMRRSACLIINQVTVNCYASLFNCTSMGRELGSFYHSIQSKILKRFPEKVYVFIGVEYRMSLVRVSPGTYLNTENVCLKVILHH